MNSNLKEALLLSQPNDPDPRDSAIASKIQDKTMLNPVLSETELSSQKNTPEEALQKNEALRPLLA